ncbi:6_t:CDS:2 [Paraglomus occultum]|uniref:6_t:CDS:1 n=1 Tax=Paraglomus occultum TaxID=144539 RepID=A0A9N9CNH5_9GLOM|nr:6_t:CDS:2 [Paraglomus occultum]
MSFGVALLVLQQVRHAYNRQQLESDSSRPVVRGAWQVHVVNAFPLRAISRLLGRLNGDYDLPVFMRKTELKPGVRVIEEKSVLVFPSDGRALAFGHIIDGRISQVKGSTYLLDALIGNSSSTSLSEVLSSFPMPITITDGKKFASLNGITYSLEALIEEDKDNAKKHVAEKKE